MATSNALNLPHPPPAPPSDSDNDTTVIIWVFVSVGCVLFLAVFAFVLCFFVRRKCKKSVERTETVHVDEHLKVKEAIVDGPDGIHAVVLSVEDDVRIEDEIKKDEKEREKCKGLDEGYQRSVQSSSNYDVEQYYSPIRK